MNKEESYRIQTLNKIASLGLNRFPRDHYEIASELPNADAILVRSAKLHDMEFPSSLKAIARAGVGVNNIPIERCTEKGIIVFNTPGANANAVKELVLCGLLLASRGIIPGINYVNSLQGLKDNAAMSKLLEQEKLDVVSVLVATVFWTGWGTLSIISLAQIFGLVG